MQPRVDLQVRYKALPRKPSAVFPETNVWLPLLDILVISGKLQRRIVALLDSGAGMNLFSTQHADLLGIDWRSGPEMEIVGVGGRSKGYGFDLKIVIPAANYAWPAKVVFSPGLDHAPLPLLGHVGFFENFEVRFRSATREFRVHLK